MSRQGRLSTIWLASLLLGLTSGSAASPAELVLTGWGGGRAAEMVGPAAAIGFRELVVHHEDAANFAEYIELGRQHQVGIYGWVYLGDLPAWRAAFPEAEPPWQVMSEAEEQALERLAGDTSPGKSGYQYGGEPAGPGEVLLTPLLCFHDPRVGEAFRRQISEILAVPGVRGVALDYFGYRNYRCCHCPRSEALLAEVVAAHPEWTAEQARERFARDSLVEFINGLTAHARAVVPEAQVIAHIYPVFLPEPLYGNRLDLDACGQTAAWYFPAQWDLDKIGRHAATIVGEESRHHPRARGAAFLGYYDKPATFPVKSPERLAAELEAILATGCRRVQVCSFTDVVRNPGAAAVFRRYFGLAEP